MKILYVSSFPPVPPNTGARQRTKLLGEALSHLGEVDFCLHSAWPVKADVVDELRSNYRLREYRVSEDPIGTPFFALMAFSHRLAYYLSQNYAPRRSYYSVRRPLANAVNRLCESGTYDLIVGRYFRCANRSGLLEYTPTCVDVDDVDWEYFASLANSPGISRLNRRIFNRQAQRLRTVMTERLQHAEIAWVTKTEDLNRVSARRNRLLPNVVDTLHAPAETPVSPASTTMLFVGTLVWRPNQLGLLRFITDILPLITKRRPDARLKVISSECPPDFVRALSFCQNVDYIGPVADLTPHYRSCLFSIVPIYFGAGSHIKILESLYYGATCIVTPFGHRGYEDTLKNGECLIAADSDATFAAACLNLLVNTPLRDRLATKGMEVVKKLYTKSAFYQRVAESIGELGIKAGSGGVRKRV